MPTILDATVVNQAYDTSGNGGRKLVRLSNGWLVAGVYDSTNKQLKLFKSSDNGATWSQMCYIQNGTVDLSRFSLSNKDNFVYVLYVSYDTAGSKYILFNKIDALTVTNTNQFSSSQSIETQTDFGNVSLAINSTGTELHAAWESKNLTYPNSFNIRYAKGTINANGSVTWGAVQQVTTLNTSGSDYNNGVSIVIKNDGNPIILAGWKTSTNSGIDAFYLTSGTWTAKGIYSSGNTSYAQSSPSACVAPNGRIWVAWMGLDSTDTSAYNIRVSYSDDGGTTWSPMQKLTSGNTYSQSTPSVTANKNNEIFVLWYGNDATDSFNDIRMIKYSSGSWGSVSIVSAGTTGNKISPSTLYDVTIDFSVPPFIYKDVQGNKVGFYGTWTFATISVTPGYIGQKTSADKSNILSYSITTDGMMSDITEKINGVTIATRTNPTSGQQFTVSLSQAQWDAIKYTTGHTLTISMGSDTWTYTFDKLLNADDDVLSAVKGVVDLPDHLNKIKAQLGAAIRAKGGTVNDTDAWSAFVSAINGMPVKKWASGTKTVTSGSYQSIRGLSFQPSVVVFYVPNTPYFLTFIAKNEKQPYNVMVMFSYGTFDQYVSSVTGIAEKAGITLYPDGVEWYSRFNATFEWIAFGQ